MWIRIIYNLVMHKNKDNILFNFMTMEWNIEYYIKFIILTISYVDK